MRMVDLIIKKRDGHRLTDEEIKYWIDGYTKGEIPDYQSSAMAMAILYEGMDDKEIVSLTDAMLHSGATMDLSSIKGVKVDKHSTGGVGDKTSLVLGPMVAACGAKLAKMSGRGLGHTGGTLDKMESIPGLSVSENKKQFVDQVNKIGIAIIGQTQSLVPADKKLYALRDVTGTVPSIPLIASSVMSKKLASGSDAICLDVTVGDGAFMKNMHVATKLAKTMVSIGNNLGKNTVAILSDMDEPLGYAVGNALEIQEVMRALTGNGPRDLMDLCYGAGSVMLVQANICKDEKEARAMLERCIKDGSALNKFLQMVEAQGGDIEFVKNIDAISDESIAHKVYAKERLGYVKHLKALAIGEAAMRLGAGRETMDDVIDMKAGILLNKKIGDYIEKGDLIYTYYTNKDEATYRCVEEEINQAFTYSKVKVKPIKVIKKIIR